MTLENRLVFVNGEFVPWDRVRVHLMCHSLGRGSAIFEVLSFHKTLGGPAVFRLDEHVSRLFRSARSLKMSLAISKEALREAVIDTVRRNGLEQGLIKIMGYYGRIAFDILPPEGDLDVAVVAVDPAGDLEGLHFPLDRGIALAVSPYRKLDPQSVPVEAKAAANYLNGMLSRLEARDRGFENAVMLDTQGFIGECATESIFLAKEGRLMTPILGTVLESITRKSLIQMAQHMGIETLEARLPSELLLEAEEVFVSGTPAKVLPVRKVEDREITPVPGPITARLMESFGEILAGEAGEYRDWLFPVT